MLESYRAVLAHRGAPAFSATGMLARLPISMMTLRHGIERRLVSHVPEVKAVQAL